MKVIECGKNQNVTYYDGKESSIHESQDGELYFYQAFIGKHSIDIQKGDSLWMLDDDKQSISVYKGPISIKSNFVATIIRGYMSPKKKVYIDTNTNLPYVNGCSTRQMVQTERIGDPTYQLLQIPSGSSEQAHHIHSTTRVVYILSGYGWSHVGMDTSIQKTRLEPGMIGVFDPMTPHHFETDNDALEPLIVLPLHIYSSSGVAEFSHPMFHGSYLMNQGN